MQRQTRIVRQWSSGFSAASLYGLGYLGEGICKKDGKTEDSVTSASGQKVYPWTSGELGETGGERPHKMKLPQAPFLTT